MKIIAGITLLSVFGIVGIFCYIIYIILERTEWQEFCPSSPIISFEKFRTLYEIDKSKWELRSDCPIFASDSYCGSLGLSFRDYLKYKKYYRYLNKKHATVNAELKQKKFEDTLDKYLESKISKIQNDLRKNTEKLKQRIEDYKSDFDCINNRINTTLPDLTLELNLNMADMCDVRIEDTENGKMMHIYADCISINQIEEIREKGYVAGMYSFINKKEEVK